MSEYRKPGQFQSLTRRCNYRKVLLALHMLTDEEGVRCGATNTEIAKHAGLSAGTVGEYVREMEWDGTIVTFQGSERSILMTDSEEGRTRIVWAMKAGARPSDLCLEGYGPLSTGRWPKARVVRSIGDLIPK